MHKIGEFIYPWGSGHYSRMIRFHDAFSDHMVEDFEPHFSSKDHVFQKLLEKFRYLWKKTHVKNIFFVR